MGVETRYSGAAAGVGVLQMNRFVVRVRRGCNEGRRRMEMGAWKDSAETGRAANKLIAD